MRRAAPSGTRIPRHWLLYEGTPRDAALAGQRFTAQATNADPSKRGHAGATPAGESFATQAGRPGPSGGSHASARLLDDDQSLIATGDGWFAVPGAPGTRPDGAATSEPGNQPYRGYPPSSADFPHIVGQSEIAEALQTQTPTLVVTDADSTLINEEVIDLLADAAGVGPQVAEITEQAMQGNLDFSWSLGQRVALLKGLPQQALAQVSREITLTPGAREFVEWAHAIGADFGVVSGGFAEVIEPLLAGLGIRYSLANRLEVQDGRLTGRTVGPVVTASLKAKTLREWAGVSLDRSVAVGDGANDIKMLHAAGMGFAFCAKPVVREQVPNYVGIRRLDAVAGLLGWSVTQD